MTATTPARAASAAVPVVPHSKRTSKPSCRCQSGELTWQVKPVNGRGARALLPVTCGRLLAESWGTPPAGHEVYRPPAMRRERPSTRRSSVGWDSALGVSNPLHHRLEESPRHLGVLGRKGAKLPLRHDEAPDLGHSFHNCRTA